MTAKMMKACLIILLTCSLMSTSAKVAISNGRCPKVASVKDFNIQMYMGRWYLYEAFETEYLSGLSCVQVQYSLRHDGDIKIVNSGISSITMFKKPLWSNDVTINGKAIIANSSRPAEWIVEMSKQGAFDDEPNYTIMATDYTSYSLVYSCTEPTALSFKVESAWILTRGRSERPANNRFLKYQLKTYNINSTNLKLTPQTGCD